MAHENGPRHLLLCLSAGEYPASLEARKVYRALPDPAAEAKGFVRVIDESGDDYLYPQTLFTAVEVPLAAAELLLASPAEGGG